MLGNFQEILTIIQEFLSFGLLISLCMYSINRWVKPSFHDYIQGLKAKKEELKNRRRLLENSCLRVDQQIIDQQERFENIEKKMQKWTKLLKDKEENKLNQYREILKDLEDKRKKQRGLLHVYKTEQEVIPKAIELSHGAFVEQYKNIEGRGLLTKLIARVEEKITP